MRREVLMPRLAEEADEGVVVTWFAEPGATIAEGDLLAELQVQKVSSELRSPFSGRVAELLVEPGGVVRLGAPIAVVEDGAGAAAAPAAAVAPEAVGGEASAAPPPASPASPAARRLARELGIDLAGITGSGPGGRIVEDDVRGAAGRQGSAEPQAAAVGGAPRLEPITPTRRAIADRLSGYLAQTAQLTLTGEADLTDLAARPGPGAEAVSVLAAAVRAVALALHRHPRLAARWTDSGLAHPSSIDIGVAVALDDGLITPVVRSADTKSAAALQAEIAGLATRARSGALFPGEVEGGCFSVTNLGAHRIDTFTPLLNPPQAAILGLGRARPRPAVVDNAVVPRLLAVLSLTFDHRVVDGAPAAAFLTDVIELLERPDELLSEPASA